MHNRVRSNFASLTDSSSLDRLGIFAIYLAISTDISQSLDDLIRLEKAWYSDSKKRRMVSPPNCDEQKAAARQPVVFGNKDDSGARAVDSSHGVW